MSSARLILVFVLWLLAAPARVQAQQPLPPTGSVGAAIGAGIGLGVVGFFAGGLTASSLARDCTSGDYCQLEAAFYGAAAGGTFGMALGVHLGNGRRGNFALDLLTGAAVWGVGIGLVALGSDDESVIWAAFITVPIAQLASTIAVERAVGRARAHNRGLALSIGPVRGGGLGVAATLPVP